MFLMMRLSEVDKLIVLKYDLGLMDYLSVGLAWGPMPCFISIVPHAPSNVAMSSSSYFPMCCIKMRCQIRSANAL